MYEIDRNNCKEYRSAYHCVFITQSVCLYVVKPDLAYLADLLNASPGNAVEPPL